MGYPLYQYSPGDVVYDDPSTALWRLSPDHASYKRMSLSERRADIEAFNSLRQKHINEARAKGFEVHASGVQYCPLYAADGPQTHLKAIVIRGVDRARTVELFTVYDPIEFSVFITGAKDNEFDGLLAAPEPVEYPLAHEA